MYSIVLILSIAACIMLWSTIFLVLRMTPSVGQQCMFGYTLFAIVQNVGYLFELTAASPDAAVIAVRIRYFGATYVMIFLCEYIYYELHKRQAKTFFQILAVAGTLLMGTMWLGSGHHLGFYLWAFCSCVLPCVLIIAGLIRYFMSGHTFFRRGKILLLIGISSVLPVLRFLKVVIPALEYDLYPVTLGLVLAMITILLLRSSTNDFSQLSVGRMIDRLDEVVLISDDLGHIIDCNRSARDMLGPDIEHYDLKDKYESVKSLNPEVLNRSYEINGRYYESRVEGIYAKNGDVIGYLIMLYETTKLHEAMEELRILKERAEDANRAKATFLSNMSHEIRTPMNTIVGIAEIMQRKACDREAKEYLASIKSSGESLLSIFNDILDYSKIETGSVQLQHAEYETLSTLHDLGLMFLGQIGERPIELLFDIDKDLPAKLVGDQVRLRQIIVNIMENAIKYTQEGYVKLTIRSSRREDGRVELSFSVADTGIGIRKEDQERIFENFTRVDTEHNNVKEGTGLGLAIARNLIERMDGEIYVESEYGMGTKFFFRLIQDAADTDEPAVDLSDQKGKRLAACMRNDLILDLLKEMAEFYEMEFVKDPREEEAIDYFFVDCDSCRQEAADMVRSLKERGTRVIILQNPMHDAHRRRDEVICSKPLYSVTFANALRGEEMQEQLSVASRAFIAPGARILIVDDNDMNLKVAKELIDPLQVSIDTAGNGEEAILKMETESPFDLILMDHMMPVMDGVEATKRIRSRSEAYFCTVPILALTANAIAGVKEEFLAVGMNDMVTKPIDVLTLYRKIRTYLPQELIIDMGDTMQLPSSGISVGGAMGAEEEKEKSAAKGSGEGADALPDIPGVDVKKGLAYCQTYGFLREMFTDYCGGVESKIMLITRLLEDEDFKNYTVEVHGLKGTSRMIGATELGGEFYELEKLGKANNLAGMRERTPEVLAKYVEMGKALKPYCNDRQ